MNSALRIQLILQAIDKATAPMRSLAQQVGKLSAPFKRLEGISGGVAFRLGRMWGHKLGSAIAASADKGRAAWSKMSSVMGSVMRMGTLAAGALTAAGYAAFKSLERLSEINDQAKMLNVSAEQIQAYGYAASLAGAGQQDFAEGLRFLARAQGEAITGNKEMLEMFQHVDLSVEQLKKLNGIQVFEAISKKFAAVGDGAGNSARKMLVMQALLGRGGAKLKQFLDGGVGSMREAAAQASKLGLVLSSDVIDAADDAGDRVATLGMVLTRNFDKMVAGAIPGINKLVDAITQLLVGPNASADAGNRLGVFLADIADRLPAIVGQVMAFGGALKTAWDSLNGMAEAIGGWGNVMTVLEVALGAKVLATVIQFGAVFVQAGISIAGALAAMNPFVLAAGVLATAGILIWRNWEPLKKFFSNLWDGMVERIRNAISWTKRLADQTSEVFAGGIATGGGMQSGGLPGAGQIGGGATTVGGTLRIDINDPNGRARVAEVKRASPSMDIEVGYGGMAMVGP